MAVTLEALADPIPSVGITVEGLDESGPSRVAVWRQHPGEGRTRVQGTENVEVTGAGYFVDYTPPLGRPATYFVEVVEGAVIPDEEDLTGTVTVESDTAWLQDALNPMLAVPVAIRPKRHEKIWFTTGAFEALERVMPSETVQVMGSRMPVTMQGTRQAPSDIPLTMITDAAEAASRLRTVLVEAQHLVLRVPPMISQVDAVVHLGSVSMPERPRRDIWYGGTVTTWEVVGTQSRGPRIGAYTALWTYDDVVELYAGMSYTDVVDGRRYVDWQAHPSDVGYGLLPFGEGPFGGTLV